MKPTLLLLPSLLLFIFLGAASAREPMPRTALWDINALNKTPEFEWEKTEGLTQKIFYHGEPYQGKPTRVFAYVGRPEGTGPFPAVVLVHGGGGKAFKAWAEHWAKRGYVSIAMDLSGKGEGGKRLEDGGPDQGDVTKFTVLEEKNLGDAWTYHSVANVMRAHSLIRSLPEVDRERTAITGISWGGYLTCIVAGLDHRFKAAVPVYGCGFLHDNSLWKTNGRIGNLPEDFRRLWIRHFDPGQHIANAKCPMLFLNGTNDFAYPLDSYRKTIEQVPLAQVTVAIHHKLRHGHIWTYDIVDTFINAALRKETPLARLGELRIKHNEAYAPRLSKTPIASTELWYTTDIGPWQKRNWKMMAGEVVDEKVKAAIPAERPISFFLQAVDERGLRTSTTHATLSATPLTKPNHATIPSPKLERDFYDWHKRHAEILRIKHEVNPDIVMIGDSITHMWGGLPKERKHVRGADSWNALFGNRGLNIGFGWDRTQNVIWRIDHGELDGITPKHVVITIGTNNLAGTVNHQAGTPEEIVAGIRTIILRVKNKLPETNIVLMAVLPRGEKPDDPNRKKVNKINAGLPALAKELNAQFIDLGPKLLDANGILSRKMAGDFLHPTAAGYQIWADTLRPIVSEAGFQE